MNKDIRLTVTVSDEIHKRLSNLAVKTCSSKAWWVRRAINNYLNVMEDYILGMIILEDSNIPNDNKNISECEFDLLNDDKYNFIYDYRKNYESMNYQEFLMERERWRKIRRISEDNPDLTWLDIKNILEGLEDEEHTK